MLSLCINLRSVLCASLLSLGLASCTHENNSTEASVAQSEAAAPAEKANCTDNSFCTREYLPTTCRLGKESFAASNRCEAVKLARRFACEKKLKFDEALVDCAAQTAPNE